MARRKLNLRLAIWLGGTFLIGCLLVHLLHVFQIHRNAGALYSLAENSAQAGDLKQASGFFHRYVKFRPDDAEGYARWAEVVVDLAESPDATRNDWGLASSVLETAVRKSPERDDLRRRLIKFQMSAGRNRDAEDHLRILLDKLPADGELLLLLSRCQIAAGYYEDAAQTLSQLVGLDRATELFDAEQGAAPEQIDGYVLLAEVLRVHLHAPGLADQVMDQLVSANDASYRAYLERSRYRLKHAQAAAAHEDIDRALQINSQDVDVLLLAAEIAQEEKRYLDARRYLEQGLIQAPSNPRIYQGLALLEMADSQDVKTALIHLKTGLKETGGHSQLLPVMADLELRNEPRDLEAVSRTISRMRQAGFGPELVDYYEARLLLAREQWIAASQELERLRPLLAEHEELVVQVDLFLGHCYERMGQQDLALKAYRRALAADGRLEVAQQGERRMTQALGQRLPDAQNPLRAKLAEVMAQPREARDWESVEQVLERHLEERQLDAPRSAILRAELCMVREQYDQGRRLLEETLEQFPEEVPLWLALANLAQRDPRQGPGEALATLRKGEERLGPKVELVLSRVLLEADANPDRLDAQLAAVEPLGNRLKPEERERLWLGLAEICRRFSRLTDAEAYLRQVAEARPNDLESRLRLFQLARQREDDGAMREALAELRSRVGTEHDSLYLYCQAARLASQAQDDPGLLEKVQQCLDRAFRIRPDWHELHLLQAEVYAQRKQYDAAIPSYYRALELGPSSPYTIRQLIQALSIRGRFEEAQQALGRLGPRQRSGMLPELQAEIYLRSGDWDEALKAAGEAIRQDPRNAAKHLWHAHVLLRGGKHVAAEAAIRRAIELDPASPQAWRCLVGYLVQIEAPEKVPAALSQARTHLDAKQGGLLQAQASELRQDYKAAESQYLATLQIAPGDREVLRELAGFYLGPGYEGEDGAQRAKKYVETILNSARPAERQDRHSAWARRTLARIIASSGTYPDLERALAIIRENESQGVLSPDDLAASATLLAMRPEAISRREAIARLQQLQKQRGLQPEEQILLAQLHNQLGEWDRCRDAMLQLLERQPDHVPAIALYAGMLLEADLADQAEHWINRLKELDKTKKNPAAVLLTAQLLARQGKGREGGERIVALLPEPLAREDLPTALRGVQVLEEIQQYGQAEKLLREVVRIEPQAEIRLAQFIGRHGDAGKAFSILEKLMTQNPAAPLQVAIDMLRLRGEELGTKYDARVERWFGEALHSSSPSAAVLLALADFRSLRQREDEAEKIYRQLLADSQLDPLRRAIVLNNLAFSLALRGKASTEAKQAIEQAIAIQGPTGALLDTRGMVALSLGNTDQAAADLRRAIADEPKPTRQFHLAVALLAKGDRLAAAEAFAEARKSGLTETSLSPLQRPHYHKLLRQGERK